MFDCPKDPVENVLWRIRCRDRAIADQGFREAFQQACFDDPLFFFNSVLWVYEPRAKLKVKPFVTWNHQDPVILAMDATLDEAMEIERPVSLTVPKSRAQGATYIYLGVFIRRALKDPGFAAGLVTRNEELVDSRTDADAVMYKLCWMLDRLPKWMLPEGYQRNSTEHTVALPNGSVFSGYAATGDVARGGRKTAFAFDEPGSEEFVQGNKDYKIMSSVGSVSNCTLLVSTFGLDSGVFYESAMDPDNRRIVRLDWKDNPEHSRNAYIFRDGEATAVRPEEATSVKEYIASHGRELKSIERRGHKMEGKVRSPWYDAHSLLPGGTPRFIARELDMDPRGAVGKLFDSTLLDTVKQRDCKAPVWQGKPVFDSETLKLTGLLQQANGPLKLWFKPGVDHSAPLGPFSVGCDIAMGSDGAYSSNSVASIIDDRTGEQVGEYTIMGMQSIVFARNVVGLCRWLRNARLGWEDSGVSGPFAKEVMETLCYGNVYYREVAEIGSRRKTRKAGWRNGKDEDKADLFEKLALAMESGKLTVRSEDLIRECGEYEWEKGKIIHRPTKNIDQSEKAHGDRCFIAGTMIRTDKGELPIELISVGDLVWTRDGLRPVQCCGRTGWEEVFRVTLSNGRTLTGTGNHPIWTENRAWVELRSILGSDRLLGWENSTVASMPVAMEPKPLCSTGGSTIGTQMPSNGTAGCTSGVVGSAVTDARPPFMLRSGSTTTDPSRRGTSFTTRTTIPSTTTSRISSASLLRSMGRFIGTVGTWMRCVARFFTPTSAISAAINTAHSGSTARSSAALIVENGTAQNYGRVLFAGTITEPIKAAPPEHAPSSAECVYVTKSEKLERRARVYNLSVAGTPEYFAQGVLVHNCIAAGVAWLVYSEYGRTDRIDTGEETGQTPEVGSWLWRERRETPRRNSDDPEYSIRDVMLT